jgi:hypothetical protein
MHGFFGVDFGAVIEQRLDGIHAAGCGGGHQGSGSVRLDGFGARAGV